MLKCDHYSSLPININTCDNQRLIFEKKITPVMKLLTHTWTLYFEKKNLEKLFADTD